jgi:TRAP-type C4-dicarboxylate transport system substrate-binding protein
VAPLIESKLGDRYVVLAISKGGWVRYFSRTPIVYPSDLARLKISLDANNADITELMQSVGARTIMGTTADFLLQINSNVADATITSPIYIAALWSQLRGKLKYMSSFKVAPFVGALVFNKAGWEKVPPDLRPALERVVKDMGMRTGVDSAKLEAEAINALDGITAPPQPADAPHRWAQQSEEWRKGPVSRLFSADILDAIDAALSGARGSRSKD